MDLLWTTIHQVCGDVEMMVLVHLDMFTSIIIPLSVTTNIPSLSQSIYCNPPTGGKLYTVFSAAAYPQFIAAGEDRVNNKGAVAILTAPTYDIPNFISYDAVRPLPEAQPYYDVGEVPGSDEEFEAIGGEPSSVTVSHASSEMVSTGGIGSDTEEEGAVEQPR